MFRWRLSLFKPAGFRKDLPERSRDPFIDLGQYQIGIGIIQTDGMMEPVFDLLTDPVHLVISYAVIHMIGFFRLKLTGRDLPPDRQPLADVFPISEFMRAGIVQQFRFLIPYQSKR